MVTSQMFPSFQIVLRIETISSLTLSLKAGDPDVCPGSEACLRDDVEGLAAVGCQGVCIDRSGEMLSAVVPIHAQFKSAVLSVLDLNAPKRLVFEVAVEVMRFTLFRRLSIAIQIRTPEAKTDLGLTTTLAVLVPCFDQELAWIDRGLVGRGAHVRYRINSWFNPIRVGVEESEFRSLGAHNWNPTQPERAQHSSRMVGQHG